MSTHRNPATKTAAAEALAAWRKDPGPDTYATADKAVYAAYLNGWHFDEVDAEICRACGAA